ncbi:uncharacterized protein RCH25_052871 [Pelodytes ibericus]
MTRGGRDPRRGVEKGFRGVQDKLLDSIGPLSRILYLADDAFMRAEEFDTSTIRKWAHDIREWGQRCFCLVGNTNVALSSERRKAALLRIDGKLVDLGTKELGPMAQGKLFGDAFLKELNRHVNVFTSLNKAQTSLRKVFRGNPTRGVFGRAGRFRGRAASRFWPSGAHSSRLQPFYPESGHRQSFSYSRGSDRGRGTRSRGRARFSAGRISHFFQAWTNISTDAWILQTVRGDIIDLTGAPFQSEPPRPISCSADYSLLIDNELWELRIKGAIEPAPEFPKGFFSNIFLVKKKTGDFRPVINL